MHAQSIIIKYTQRTLLLLLPVVYLWPYRSHNWSVVLRELWYTLSILIERTLGLWISDDYCPVTVDCTVRRCCLHCTLLTREAICEIWKSLRSLSSHQQYIKIPVVWDEWGIEQVQPGSVPMKFGARVCRAIHDMPRPSRENSLICTGPNSPISLNTWSTSIQSQIAASDCRVSFAVWTGL